MSKFPGFAAAAAVAAALAACNSSSTSSDVPKLTAHPDSVVFGRVPTGTGARTDTVTVSNTGNFAATALSFTATGAGAANYTVMSPDCTNTTSLAPGASCMVIVTFTPPSTTGPDSAILLVSAQPGTVNVAIPLKATVTPPGLTIVPASHDFDTLAVSTTASFAFSVTNTATTSTGTLSTSFTGTDATLFTLMTNGCPTTLAAGASCTVTIQFAPLATGNKSATFMIFATPGDTASAVLTGIAN